MPTDEHFPDRHTQGILLWRCLDDKLRRIRAGLTAGKTKCRSVCRRERDIESTVSGDQWGNIDCRPYSGTKSAGRGSDHIESRCIGIVDRQLAPGVIRHVPYFVACARTTVGKYAERRARHCAGEALHTKAQITLNDG